MTATFMVRRVATFLFMAAGSSTWLPIASENMFLDFSCQWLTGHPIPAKNLFRTTFHLFKLNRLQSHRFRYLTSNKAYLFALSRKLASMYLLVAVTNKRSQIFQKVGFDFRFIINLNDLCIWCVNIGRAWISWYGQKMTHQRRRTDCWTIYDTLYKKLSL